MAHKVKIAARLRPRLPAEVDDDGIQVIRSPDGTSCISVRNPRDISQVFNFPFTSCYDQNSTQQEIYTRDVEPMIDVVYSGVTVTIFAYGVTSSGKTHTMQGSAEHPGVIPRVVQGLFAHPALHMAGVQLSVSYMEIYKDECYDLLKERETAPKLPVRENDVGKVFVANLSVEPINSVDEFDVIYSRANKQRSVGSTNLNRASSRSHAIMTIEVSGLPTDIDGKTLTGKINLVDLAGSENNKLTGNDPSRMAESAAINKSLSVLGQVVHALNSGASRIPYRNSKLTRILQDALGGSSVGLLICNLAPGNKFRQDTLNTLNFAVRTKNVENKPVINERDSRPAPKPHFAAVPQRAPKPQAASIPTGPLPPIPGSSMCASSSSSSDIGPLPTMVPHVTFPATVGPRSSIAPAAMGGHKRRPSRVPRMSVAGLAALGLPFGSATSAGLAAGSGRAPARAIPQPLLNDEEMDERIRRIVEAEVARRLEGVREQEREAALVAAREEARAEIDAVRKEHVARGRSLERIVEAERSLILQESFPQREGDKEGEPDVGESSREHEQPSERGLPSGVLTPLLKRHADLDSELMQRLEDLEKRYERGDKEVRIADVLSPVSRKKTGRAYVALARAHTEKGDLRDALEFYRKAEKYVPDNQKLKERILEMEWCVNEGKPFNPSPKKTKRSKSSKLGRESLRKRRSSRSRARTQTDASANGHGLFLEGAQGDGSDDDNMEVEHLVNHSTPPPRERRSKKSEDKFGKELTNGLSMPGALIFSPGKRHADDDDITSGEIATAEVESVDAPPRRKRKSAAPKTIEVEDSEDEGIVASTPRRSKRRTTPRAEVV